MARLYPRFWLCIQGRWEWDWIRVWPVTSRHERVGKWSWKWAQISRPKPGRCGVESLKSRPKTFTGTNQKACRTSESKNSPSLLIYIVVGVVRRGSLSCISGGFRPVFRWRLRLLITVGETVGEFRKFQCFGHFSQEYLEHSWCFLKSADERTDSDQSDTAWLKFTEVSWADHTAPS